MSQHSRTAANRPPRVFVHANERLSRAMSRVASALAAYAPSNGVDIVTDEDEADIVVLHVIGYPDTLAAIESLKARGKKYAMIQYCVRSTQKPSTVDWVPLWGDESCVAVWSYYDLPTMLLEDLSEHRAQLGDLPEMYADALRQRFYFAPMGASPQFEKFAPSGRNRPYRLMTSGYVAESECIEESTAAVVALEARMFHLGPGFPFFGPNVTQEEGVNDPFLVELYNRSEYVAGLRRCEGFEMPALEGLLCGARPVCFDRPHYRHWFGDHAEYIPEDDNVIASLVEVLARPARPVTEEERAAVVAKFNWRTIVDGFYSVLAPDARARLVDRRLRLLWVGDAIIASGFGKSTHALLNTLSQHYDVAVLGINYNGDPHPYPYPIYPAINHMSSGDIDGIGIARVVEITRRHNADIVVIQQDPWNFPQYVNKLREADVLVPVVGFVAVDAKNCKGHALNCLDHAIFWTEFGRDQAVLGGYKGASSVISLGVDLAAFYPMPKVAARRLLELPVSLHHAFIVGNINRNQPRKRLDLTVEYFCEWAQRHHHEDAFLYLHVAPTGDIGWDIEQLMRYYGFGKRLILAQPDPGFGATEQMLCATYNSFDVQITTTAGEGWGLPTLEGMACGVPQIVPDWAALGEWPAEGAIKIVCSSTAAAINNLNTIGGIPDREDFIGNLEMLYTDRTWRASCAERALERATDPMFDWRRIGQAFVDVLKAETPRLLGREVARELAPVEGR